MTLTPTEILAMAGRLKSLHAKATQGVWRKFTSIYGNSTIAIMLGNRPPERERWPEIIHWAGFDSSDVSVTRQHANARLIVGVVNALPDLLAALEQLLTDNAQLTRESAMRELARDAGQELLEDRLREAEVEPFAAWANVFELHGRDYPNDQKLYGPITMGDLRRAAAALASAGERVGGE